MKIHVKKNDTVIVVSGKDKGKTGEVLKAYPKTGKVLVQGVNIVKKHQKANRSQVESAIIEKDYTAAKLAELVGAGTLLFLTGYDRLTIEKGLSSEKVFEKVSAKELHHYINEGHFPAKTTFPKVDASIRFVTADHSRKAIITSVDKAKEGLSGKAGTLITA